MKIFIFFQNLFTELAETQKFEKVWRHSLSYSFEVNARQCHSPHEHHNVTILPFVTCRLYSIILSGILLESWLLWVSQLSFAFLFSLSAFIQCVSYKYTEQSSINRTIKRHSPPQLHVANLVQLFSLTHTRSDDAAAALNRRTTCILMRALHHWLFSAMSNCLASSLTVS